MHKMRSVIISGLLVICSLTTLSQEVDFSFMDINKSIEERSEILVSQMTLEEKINQLKNAAPAIPRLKVPDYDWWNEALHGMARNGKATIFPQIIGLGATFDPDLAREVADAIATEARAKYDISQEMGNHSRYSGLTFWTPNVNLFRDPRWGRGQETYGEDPLLMSKMGIAFVKGLQGEHPKYLKTAACAKHYVVHSGPESLRLEFNAEPTQQDLYESYFPSFEALVREAKVEGVMPAHNAVFGQPMAANKFLLTDILRDKWGFDGYTVTDCGAIWQIKKGHKYVDSDVKGAALALKAGTNLNCGKGYSKLIEAVKKGLIKEDLIHKRAVQLFKTRFRLGMFDKDTSKNPYLNLGKEHIHSERHIKLARKVAQKSIVLLKNKNNILPLSPKIKVPYVTGPFANSGDMMMGNYYGVSSNIVTILEGITDAVSLGTSLNYRSGALPFHDNINPRNFAPVVASRADVTICVVGLTADREGEGVDAIASDSKGDRVDLKLPQNQINYIKKIIEVKKDKPLILVIASGSPVSLEGIEEGCDAILQIWYPGEQGGNAVADVIFGKVSPTGHLPITFPKNVNQLPPFEDYHMKGRTYKYMTEEPMFPFGFGLTYSKTAFKNLAIEDTKLTKKESLKVSVEVENVGDFDIDEVVQLYISPKSQKDDEGLPLTTLKAFKRISLKKGTTKKVEFEVSTEELKVINVKGEKVWRKGVYKISVGNSSPSELSTKLGAAKFQETEIVLK